MTYKWRQFKTYRYESNGQTIDYECQYKVGSFDNYRSLRSAGIRRYGKHFSLSWEEYKERNFNLYRYV